MIPCVLPVFATGLLALSLYLEKNRIKKQFVFENFSHHFRQTPVFTDTIFPRNHGNKNPVYTGTRFAPTRIHMNFNRHLFPMEGSYGIV